MATVISESPPMVSDGICIRPSVSINQSSNQSTQTNPGYQHHPARVPGQDPDTPRFALWAAEQKTREVELLPWCQLEIEMAQERKDYGQAAICMGQVANLAEKRPIVRPVHQILE